MNFSIKLPLLIISLIQISSVISNSIFADTVHGLFISHLYGASFMQNVPAGKAKYLKDNGDIETVPYIVQLENNKSELFCGGSIIRDDVIITAGHCLQDVTPESFLIRAGSVIRGKSMNVTQLAEVETYEINPEFYANTTQMGMVLNDIGLVRLKNKLELNDYVNIIPLAKDDMADKLSGEEVVTYGWGLTETTYPADVLKFTNLTIIQKQECNDLYKNKVHISESNLCALDKRREMAAICKGDSGGPLILQHKQHTPNVDYLVGISSFSNLPGYMCKPDYPSVFTDVAKLKPWIQDTLSKWN